jgi:hypothetical protein
VGEKGLPPTHIDKRGNTLSPRGVQMNTTDDKSGSVTPELLEGASP